MSTYYFIKATEHSLDVVYLPEGCDEKIEVTVPRGQTFEFTGDIVSQWPTPGTELLSQDGMAGSTRVTIAPPAPTPETVIVPVPPVVKDEPVIEPIVEETEPEPVAAPKKRGRKSNAEKAAEAEAAGTS